MSAGIRCQAEDGRDEHEGRGGRPGLRAAGVGQRQPAVDRGAPREIVEPLLLMLAPLAPHIAEELWSRLDHPESLAWEPFPVADPGLLTAETVQLAV